MTNQESTSKNRWQILHQVMEKTWQAMNGMNPMPPNFPMEVINSLDDNIRIIYFDLLKLYDISDVVQQMALRPNFKGYFATFAEIEALVISTLRNGDFVYCAEPVPPSETGNVWIWNFENERWEDTGTPVPDQMVPPSTMTPLPSAMQGNVGTVFNYALADHVHPKSDEEFSVQELLSKQFYTGKLYEQKPNDPDPYELIEMGVFPEGSVWEVWSHRAELYELVPAESYPSDVTEYTTGSAVPANAYRLYQLAGDDRQIWKANKALTNLPAQNNPLNWDKLSDITCVPRRKLQPDWNDDDLEIGTEITHNGQQMVVAGIIVLGGKFLVAEGGKRPTFVLGGVQGDAQRKIIGNHPYMWCEPDASQEHVIRH